MIHRRNAQARHTCLRNASARLAVACGLLILPTLGRAARLQVEAVNGSVIVSPQKETYEVGETVELLTRPDNGYSFAQWGGDARGHRLVLRLTMDGDKHISATFAPWRAPIGIPEPGFGIHETHRQYAGQTYDYASGPGPYRDAGDGPYTHYVDNRHPKATDSGNPYGTADRPRASLPAADNIKPGAVIEMHGGPYDRRLDIALFGTADQPVYLRGSSRGERPIYQGRLYIAGRYAIVENLDIDRNGADTGALSVGPRGTREEVHHVSIRSCEIHNYHKGYGRNTTVMGAGASLDDPKVHDVVFYNNHIHPDCLIPPGSTFERDLDGIGMGYNCDRVWVVDNHIHHLPGDCFGSGHNAKYKVTNFFVGRNIMHDTSENAVDLKEADGVIVSENLMYNFAGKVAGEYAGGGGDGTAVVVHYGQNGLSTKNVWFLYNEMHSCNDIGIQIGGGQEHDVYILGNVVHDIHNGVVADYLFASFDQSAGSIHKKLLAHGYIDADGQVRPDYQGLNAAFRREFPADYPQFPSIDKVLRNALKSSKTAVGYRTWSSQKVFLVGNTFYDMDNGIESHVDKSGAQLILRDSIVSTMSDSGYHLSLEGSSHVASADIRYNLFYQPGGQARVTRLGEGCLEADPQFIDAKNLDFRLKPSSPAIDAGRGHPIYQLYQTRYGIDISVDTQGLVVPQGRSWDIGAFEHQDDTTATREEHPVPLPTRAISAGLPMTPLPMRSARQEDHDDTTAREAATTSVPTGTGAPLLRPISDLRVSPNVLLRFPVTALDPEAGPIVYSARSLPKGATFTILDQVFSWTPRSDQVGTHEVTFTARNKAGESSETVTITVSNTF